MAARYTIDQTKSLGLPFLQAVHQNVAAPSVVLDRQVCVIGARRPVHLPLADASISKAQALLVRDAMGIYLRDLASLNHTYVNDEPIHEAWLQNGDVIRIGPFEYTCDGNFDAMPNAAEPENGEIWFDGGIGSRQVVSLDGLTYLIGSRGGCDLTIDAPEIALAHAVIFLRAGHRFVRDLSSHTGTLVNGSPCREKELSDGDEIIMGTTRGVYHPVAPAVEFEPAVHAAGSITDAPLPLAFDDEETAVVDDDDTVTMPWDEPDVQVAAVHGSQVV